MGKYSEALAIGQRNLDTYTRFYGELNYMRFEQFDIVFKCLVKLKDEERIKTVRESVLKIGCQLLSEDYKQLKELMEL